MEEFFSVRGYLRALSGQSGGKKEEKLSNHATRNEPERGSTIADIRDKCV